MQIEKEEKPKILELSLNILSVKRVFKGDTEEFGNKVDKIKEGFEKRKLLKLRSLERVLFGTGIFLRVEKDIKDLTFEIEPLNDWLLEKGLFVLNNKPVIDEDNEVCVIVYNSSLFLNKVQFNDNIAKLKLIGSNTIDSLIVNKKDNEIINQDIKE